MRKLQPAAFAIAMIFYGFLLSSIQAEEIPVPIYKEIQRLAELESLTIEKPTSEAINSKRLGTEVGFHGTAENFPAVFRFKASLVKSKKLKGFEPEWPHPRAVKGGGVQFYFLLKPSNNKD